MPVTPWSSTPLWREALAATVFMGFTIFAAGRKRTFGAPVFCIVALLLGIVACGGSGSGTTGGGGSGGGGAGAAGTPAGTYTVTVTGTAGSTTHTTTFTLIVQ
jgi:hypothetical protein